MFHLMEMVFITEYSGYYESSILDQVNPDDLLSPVEKMKKYCISENIFTR